MVGTHFGSPSVFSVTGRIWKYEKRQPFLSPVCTGSEEVPQAWLEVNHVSGSICHILEGNLCPFLQELDKRLPQPAERETVPGCDSSRYTTLKMEAACSSKISMVTYKTTWCHNQEHLTLNSHCCENLRT
jgi:hypothetical protein